jgi:hypothetical protein
VSAQHRLLLPPPRHATAIFQCQRSAAIPMLFDCCLMVPMLIVLTSLRLIQRHRPIYTENSANTSTGMVQFQYWASTGAHTGIGTARWRSFPVRALAKCRYQYWQCRDGVHFQYGHLPSARTSIGIAAMEFISSTGTCQVPVPVLAWRLAAQTSEFHRTLEKLRIRK